MSTRPAGRTRGQAGQPGGGGGDSELQALIDAAGLRTYRVTRRSSVAIRVTQRDKRSVSLPPELARAIDEAAADSGTTFNAWITETASHRLRLEAAPGCGVVGAGPRTPNRTRAGRGVDPGSGPSRPRRWLQALGVVAGVTYDSGVLIAGKRNDRRMWALHVGFMAEEVIPVVPAPVLAGVWRGGPRQASLARMLAGCGIEEMSADQARRVGELAGRSGHDDVGDVTVVEGAVRRGGDVLVTSIGRHEENADR